MSEIAIVPWFGGVPVTLRALEGTDKVAYSWGVPHGVDPQAHVPTIRDLLVWHDCDRRIWLEHPDPKPGLVRDAEGWTPTGVGLHTLVDVEPLHIEASVYWPGCCGLHGFIRGGRWVPA